MIHEELSKRIIGVFYDVYNGLGCGFLEKVYENAMMVELKSVGIEAEQQKRIDVRYRGIRVGEYYADIVVNNTVVLELKVVDSIVPEYEAQLINYLKGTEFELGFIFNFGPKPEFKRRILTNNQKQIREDR